MSQFNDFAIGKMRNTYATIDVFRSNQFARQVFLYGLPKWKQFHDSVLQNFQHPLLVVEYEKLKSDSIFEMERILSFLGFDMTDKLKSCLLKDSIGDFKRKSRPQKEMDQIYRNFTSMQLNQVHNTYQKYLKKFQLKINDLQIRQNLQSKHNKYEL